MGRVRFVGPKVVRLELSEGDWIEVKERLSWGERNEVASVGTSAGPDGRLVVNVPRWNQALVTAYLTDWSFRDEADKPVDVTPDAIAALDQETAGEILDAIDRHEKAQKDPKEPKTAGGTST